jgi:hypothetical protein
MPAHEDYVGTVVICQNLPLVGTDRAKIKEWVETECQLPYRVAFIEYVPGVWVMVDEDGVEACTETLVMPGTPTATIRMKTKEDASKLLAAVSDAPEKKKTLGDGEVELEALQGEEEEAYWQKIT